MKSRPVKLRSLVRVLSCKKYLLNVFLNSIKVFCFQNTYAGLPQSQERRKKNTSQEKRGFLKIIQKI